MAEETGIVLTSTGESDKTFVVPSMAYSIGATGLTPDTTYNVTAYYTNAQGSTIYTPQATEFKTLPEVKDDWLYIENVGKTSGTMTIRRLNGFDMEYTFDKETWETADLSSDYTLTVNAGEKVYLRGNNTAIGDNPYQHFAGTFDHAIGGNILSLLDKTNYQTITDLDEDYALTGLFFSDSRLVDASDCNFGSLQRISGRYGCYRLFSSCSMLKNGPDLSGIEYVGLSGLSSAFMNCSSLDSMPDFTKLNEVGQGGLTQIFYATALAVPPEFPNLETIGYGAMRYAFSQCKSLVTAPNLSSVTSVDGFGLERAYEYSTALKTVYTPNVSSWSTTSFRDWVNGAGDDATGRIMYTTKELLDVIPSGTSGYGKYNLLQYPE